MIPQKGQYVKIVFRNGTLVEGYVETWSNKASTLKTENSKNYFVITHTDDDVMAYKIMIEQMPLAAAEHKLQELQDDFTETYESPSVDDLRVKRLAQLRVMMAEQEKQIVAQRLQEHTPTRASGVKYGSIFDTIKK